MLKYLQTESQSYFGSRSYAEAFEGLSSSKQRANFYAMLLCGQLSLPSEAAVGYLGAAAAGGALDAGALLAAVWGVSLQVAAGSEEARRLAALVGLLHARSIVDRTQLLADLPDWVVQAAGLVDGAASDRRVARVYTKINYEQSKHSLLRENNEGYAKVALLLVNLRDCHDAALTWQRMLDLVGNFDLDPDRVLDLVVEARIHNFGTAGYLLLLDQFRRESIAVVVGNKLRACRGKAIEAGVFEKLVYAGPLEGLDGEGEELEQAVSPHLISLCGELVKRGSLRYEDLLPYLEPGDHAIRHVNSKRVELALQKVKECFTLSMEELDDAEKLRVAAEENLRFEGQLLYSTKLALIAELVRLNDWVDFEAAWAPFRDKIDLLLYQPLLRNLLDLIEWAIDPLVQATGYHRFFRFEKPSFRGGQGGGGQGGGGQERGGQERGGKERGRIAGLEGGGVRALEELLGYVGKYVGLRARLFIKLCRVVRREAREGRGESVRGVAAGLVMGSCVAENNAAMAMELFEVLDCYDYQFRYECYLRVYRGGMSECPVVARIFESIKRRQNIIVNNLSKENKKLFIRKVSKLTHNQALPVFYWIVRRIVMEDYEAVVPEIVAVICNCAPLTLDIAIFVMLYTLNESKEPPVNAKTHDCYPWFKNVTTFISNFFRKYLETDIQPVFDYIIMKTSGTLSELDDDELPGDLLKLLHEILNKMHGSVMISEVNKTKYDAIAAGPRLQAEILELTSEVRAAKKSKVFLQKFFWEKNAVHQDGYSLAFNLLVLLAQKRAELFTKCYVDDIKIVGEIFDEYSMLIVQVVRVLLYQAQDYSHYAQLLPTDPVRVLLRDYKLPLEIACEVVRPGVKHIAVMTAEEWAQLTADFRAAYSECLADDRFLVKSSRASEKWAGLLEAYKEKVLEYIPIAFFTAFWFLTLDSVYFPAKSYSEKIDDLKKKLEPGKRGEKERGEKGNERGERGERGNEKEAERMRGLLEKLSKEEEAQRKKYSDTLSAENLKKLEVEMLHSNTEKGREGIFVFAEQFVQTCLLPRMMLDRTEALYCVKFTIEMIKANRMAVTKCIRLLTFIIEYVMGYLPFTTHREAANCISVYLGEILSIFNNWNDSAKLKQDLSKILGVEEPAGKDNYPKLKDYLIKLFERVGNTLRGVKEEPYLIKNCLYILEKVDSIPSYKEQADELAQHMNELKEMYPTVDMRTSLDRQIAILTAKKNDLPDRPEEKKPKADEVKPAQQKDTTVVRMGNPPKQLPPASQAPPSIAPNVPASAATIPPANLTPTRTTNTPAISNNGHKRQPEPKPAQNKPAQNKLKPEIKPEERGAERATNEQKQPEKPKSRFTEKPVEKKAEVRTEDRKNDGNRRLQTKGTMAGPVNPEGSRFTEQKVEQKPVTVSNPPPKTVKQMREEMQRQMAIQAQAPHPPAVQAPLPVLPVQLVAATQSLSSGVTSPMPVSTLPAGGTADTQNPSSAKPRQQESNLTVGPLLRSQRPVSSATIEPTNQPTQSTKTIPQKEREGAEKSQQRRQNKQLKPSIHQKNSPNLQKTDKEREKEKERRAKLSPTPERKKEERWKDSKDNNYKRDRDFQQRENKEKEREQKEGQRDNRESRDPNKEKEQGKPKSSYVFTRERKSEDRREESRKQEKRDRSKEREKERQSKEARERENKEKQREREKNKDRDRGYDKYRQRSPNKYGRR